MAGTGASQVKKAQTASFGRWLSSLARLLPHYLATAAAFSIAINLLLLVSPVYMLQVYDRVLTSGSYDTLIWLTVIALFLLAIYGVAEAARRRLCALASEALHETLAARIFRALGDRADGPSLSAALRSAGQARSVLQHATISTVFDLPFVPLFLGVLFAIHPAIGALGAAGGVLVLALATLSERLTRRGNEAAAALAGEAQDLAAGLSRQRSAIAAMGLGDAAHGHWSSANRAARNVSLEAAAVDGGFAAAARAARQALQILILGAGAGLAVAQEMSPGSIVAASIILSRALAPIDQIVGSWRSIAGARAGFAALDAAFDLEAPAGPKPTPLPRPDAVLSIDRLAVSAPGAPEPVIRPFSIRVEGGRFLTTAGALGSGKTSLLQTIAGAWRPASGAVALGGRSIHAWPATDRGRHMGYVPQAVELLPGSIAENIARMGTDDMAGAVDAARRAGAHDMILALPNAYDTPVGPGGDTVLSAGQRQLVGLARAFYGSPPLLVLDEPTANLDPQAAKGVAEALRGAARAGAIVIAATHDRRLIAESDDVLAIRAGAVLVARADVYLNAPTGASTKGAVA